MTAKSAINHAPGNASASLDDEGDFWKLVLSLPASAAGAVWLALSLQPVVGWLKWFLDIDGKPIRSIGVVVALIGAIFWWGLVLIAEPEGEIPVSAATAAPPAEPAR